MTIEIAEYSSAWPEKASEIIAELEAAAPGAFVRVEHFGSTSVPGLAAKPIIDLMAGVEDLAVARERLDAVVPALGFEAEDNGMPERFFYFRTRDGHRDCHLHVVLESSIATRNEILLRDLLRRDPEAAARYAADKREIAGRVGDDGFAYTVAKTGLIQELVDRARTEAGLELENVWEEA